MSAQDHASSWTRHHSGDDVADDGAEPDTLEDIRVALDLLADRAAHVTDWPKELGRVQVRVEAMQRRDGLHACRPYDPRLDDGR